MRRDLEDELPRSIQERRRRTLERALLSLRESSHHLGEAERAVADYCRDRHREGADPQAVIVEIKRIANPILRDVDGRLDELISSCIRHYYRDVEIR